MYEYADKAEMIQIAHGEKDGDAFSKKGRDRQREES